MQAPAPFRSNDWPTLGVELELQLVDVRTMGLKSAIAELLGALPAGLDDWVKPEFLQCYVELNTGICRTVPEVGADLEGKIRTLEEVADRCGVGLLWAATHPFSRWRDQQITPNERYHRLAETLRETIVRPVTFGMHVHVGVESGDKAVRVMDRLHRYLPLLLALSANSPFWHGRATGHHAHRIELLEAAPTGGTPPRLGTWADYLARIDRLRMAGCIESQKDLWWDVRPSPSYGTVEVRICDMPADLPAVLGLTALIQCLVSALSDEVDRGEPEPECDPLVVRQSRWRACRYGLEAMLVDPASLETRPARGLLRDLGRRLRPVARRLGCDDALGRLLEPGDALTTGAQRQLDMFEQDGGTLSAVVQRLVARSRLSPQAFAVRKEAGGLVAGYRGGSPVELDRPRPGAWSA